MRYIKTADAVSGSILARTVYGTDGRVLVKAGTMLTSFLIRKLDVLGYPNIYVYGADEADTALKMMLDEHTRIRTAADLQNIDIDRCIMAADEITRQVLEARDIAAEVSRISCYDLCTWTHSVDVCTYSVMCGIAMGYTDRELKELSQAALLHDIGKVMVRRDILCKPGKLTDEEYAMMKKHAEYGLELVRGNTSLSASVYASIYEHHENEDGSGYPRGVSGDRIHRYAKVIHAADVYEALTAIRPYKKAVNPADAIENLMSGYGTVFDAHVVDVLRSVTILYPVGRQVLLSDGRPATVEENHRSMLQRPVVKLPDGTRIDLCEKLDLTILKLLD